MHTQTQSDSDATESEEIHIQQKLKILSQQNPKLRTRSLTKNL
jgi:hypothetical protein